MNRKPNVLIMIATDIVGGPGKGLFQLLRYDNELDFRYVLCNFYPTFLDNSNVEFYKKAEEEGIDLQLLKQDWKIDPLLVWRAYKLSKKYDVNIVQTHSYKSNIIGFLLKKIFNIPWIGFAHGYTDDNIKMGIYNKLDSFALKFADRVVAVSDSMKQLLSDKGVKDEKIVLIKNAVAKNELLSNEDPMKLRASLQLNENDVVIGVIGRLCPEKGQIEFLKALKKVIGKMPDAKALIIGDGQERDKLLDFCKSNDISHNVIFTGHLKNIADYYQIMDLVVIPSYSEGLPNVLLEAMALGIPVIATSVGGIPEVIDGTNGVLMPPGDPDVMSSEIISLLKDKKRVKKICEKAIQRSLSFSPEVRAQKIVDLYHDILRQ